MRPNSKSIDIPIVVFSFFAVGALVATVIVRNSRRKSHQKAKIAKETEELFKSNNVVMRSARMFSIKELKKATNGFAKDRILGVGGFCEVYKGELGDGTAVTVKLAKVGNIKNTQQVLNEVGILSQVNHKNLVRLLGCCVEARQPLMVYGYISRGTLHHHLHGERSDFLNWKLRLHISLQTAEALAYVAQRADSVMDVVDRRLVGEEPCDRVLTSIRLFCKLALACLREKKGDRPTMKDVVQELQSILEIINQEEISCEASVEIT